MMDEERCPVCNGVGRVRCDICFSVGLRKAYCNRAHLLQDARDHKKECKAFTLDKNERLGRYLVATRFIKKGETIINEKPIVTGPDESWLPSCLTCEKRLGENKYKCSTCGWPMCSKKCEKDPVHKGECKYTDKDGIVLTIVNYSAPHPFYKYVPLLRCLYLRESCPEQYAVLLNLESHMAARTRRGDHKTADELKKRFKLQNFTRDEVRRISGAWDVNRVMMQDRDSLAIYDTCSMFAHDCMANAYKSINRYGHLVIRASLDIRNGEIITISYVSQLSGNVQRRANLNVAKYFICECRRCTDPTDLGTHLDSLICQKCKTGLIIPPADTIGEIWSCRNCDEKLKKLDCIKMLSKLMEDMNECQKKCQFDKFLEDTKHILSENHYIRLQSRMQFCLVFKTSYALFDKNYAEGTRMEEKYKSAKELLKICDIIQEGHGQLRGAIMRVIQHVLIWKCGRLGVGMDDEKAEVMKELVGVRDVVKAIFTPEAVCKRDLGILDDISMVTMMLNSQYVPKE